MDCDVEGTLSFIEDLTGKSRTLWLPPLYCLDNNAASEVHLRKTSPNSVNLTPCLHLNDKLRVSAAAKPCFSKTPELSNVSLEKSNCYRSFQRTQIWARRKSCAGVMESRRPLARPDPGPSSIANDSASSSSSEPKRVGFEDLCDEILVEIIRRVGTCEHIEWRAQRYTFLFNLAMCSHRLLKLAEPILFEELTQVDYPYKRVGAQRVFKIFRKILSRPDLGRCVKRFNFSDTRDQIIPFVAELTDQDQMRLRAVVHEASASEEEAHRWIQAVESGQWAAIVALLLSMTPNVESLTLEGWAGHNNDYDYLLATLDRAKRLQNSGEASPFAMSKLRSVSVDYWDTEGGMTIQELIPFLELQSVETFQAHMVLEDSFAQDLEDPILEDPLFTLNTKNLSFPYSAISPYNMVAILRWFPHLERFHYEFGSCEAYFEPPRMKALEHLKPCLKELTILGDLDLCLSHVEGFPIGSLADFQKLVSITANVSIMIGQDCIGEGDGEFEPTQNLVDVVPPTLEFLCLTDCQRHVVRHIFELVSQKSLRTPALRKIDLGWQGITYPDRESPVEPILHPGFSKDEVNKLMTDCKEAAIEIIIKYFPPEAKSVTYVEEGERGIALPKMVRQFFEYPYEGYEDYCEQHGCDPETGRPRGT